MSIDDIQHEIQFNIQAKKIQADEDERVGGQFPARTRLNSRFQLPPDFELFSVQYILSTWLWWVCTVQFWIYIFFLQMRNKLFCCVQSTF